MQQEDDGGVTTWGQVMAREAKRLVARHSVDMPWLREFSLLLRRVTSRPGVSENRFRRVAWPDAAKPALLTVAAPEAAGVPLSSAVRQRLAPFPHPGLAAMRVHHGPAGDHVARAGNADAVAIERHVFFRQNRYRPDDPAGMALIAHEAEHVLAALRPDASWRRATSAGVQEEERSALRSERDVTAALTPIASHAIGSRSSESYPAAADSADLNSTDSVGARAIASQSVGPPSLVSQDLAAVFGPLAALPQDQRAGPRESLSAALPQRVLGAPAPAALSLPGRPMAAAADRDAGEASSRSASVRDSPDMEQLRRTLYRDLMSQIRSDLERGA